MLTNLYRLFQKWFPGRVNPAEWQDRLAQFYATNEAYHAMTATSGKEAHPQVQLLLSMVKKSGCYAEVGCGGGAVARLLGRQAMVHGFDVSPIAIAKAKAATNTEQAAFTCVEGAHLPLADATVDGCYSFEVLEHIWDPVAVIGEMVRVTKPGGFIMISMPNHYSLDLHLSKRPLARWVERLFALCRYGLGSMTSRLYWNIRPELAGEVYPDCDLVTTLNPLKISQLFSLMGCRLEFVDSTYMCAHREDAGTTLDYQKNTARPMLKHFGDHWLILAYKQRTMPE
jgi:SAM-dependent methyltransferase